MIGDERHTKKTPRWWAVAPPTPAEAPQAKRRTAARSRGSIALVLAVVVAFVVSVFMLFFRIGRQVGGGEPVVASLVGSAPVAPASPLVPTAARPVAPSPSAVSEQVGVVPEGADAAAPPSGPPAAKSRPTREVFRKPGF